MKNYNEIYNEFIEKSKGLVEDFMTYQPHERKWLLSILTGEDPEIIVSLSWNKCDCIDNYLGDLNEFDYDTVFYEDSDFGEDKYEEVRTFLMSSEYDLIWDILELSSEDEYEFVNVGQHINENGSREEFFQYELSELIEGVYNHPEYKTYMRDMKLQGLGL